MRTLQPYTGITDFTHPEQVQRMLAVFQKLLPQGSSRRLHVGVMMSRKTLNGEETKWSKVFPANHEISTIFFSEETYNCLHYADYGVPSDEHLSENLTKAIEWCGASIHALQLDMTWPEPFQIAETLSNIPRKIEVILQIGEKSFEQIGPNMDDFVRKLDEYEGIVHRVLLDKSMGKGKPLDANFILPYARTVKRLFPGMGIGVAGGLGPKSMDLILPFLSEFPGISIDAQGQLRPSGDNFKEPIHWSMARDYLAASFVYLS